jgi:hypothetical protein
MARYDNEWDRDRDRDRDRGRDRGYEERGRNERPEGYSGSEYGSRAGWGGQGFSQGSFGRYGSQGERLYNDYGGQGYGAEHGYWGRQSSGGMGSYMGQYGRGGERGEQRWGSQSGYGQGSEGWGRDRWGESYQNEGEQDRDREPWGRDWGGQGFSGREGGWGGYGSYDRERGGYLGRGEGYDRWSGGPRSSSGENWNADWRGRSTYGQGSPQGRHTGRGPRNYHRSDDRIREDISERLTQHPEIDASDIDVEVHNGEVTLKGTVDERHAKRSAEDLAEQVSGVKQVHNQLRVEQRHENVISAGHSGATTTGQPAGLHHQEPTTTSGSSAQKQGELTGAKK